MPFIDSKITMPETPELKENDKSEFCKHIATLGK